MKQIQSRDPAAPGTVYGWDSEKDVPPHHVRLSDEEIGARNNPKLVIDAEVVAARRYGAEIAGITVGGLLINTDDRSKLLINGAALEATIDPAYAMQWKTPSGFVELTGEQVIGIARAVRAHVQACFDREAELLAALDAGTLTEEALAAFWPMPAEEDV